VLRAVQTFGGVGGLFDAGDRELAVLGFSHAAVARIRGVDWSAVHREQEILKRIRVSIVPIGTSLYPARLAAKPYVTSGLVSIRRLGARETSGVRLVTRLRQPVSKAVLRLASRCLGATA